MSAELLETHLRAAGIAFEREVMFWPGRKWRFDFAWPDRKVACEVNGGVFIRGRHNTGVGSTKDAEKLSHAAMAGWRVLIVTPAQVKSGDALEWIERALA
jgi:very-short-patch-repair endonuclease